MFCQRFFSMAEHHVGTHPGHGSNNTGMLAEFVISPLVPKNWPSAEAQSHMHNINLSNIRMMMWLGSTSSQRRIRTKRLGGSPKQHICTGRIKIVANSTYWEFQYLPAGRISAAKVKRPSSSTSHCTVHLPICYRSSSGVAWMVPAYHSPS